MARRELFLALLCLAGLATGAAGARKMVGVYELRTGDFSVKITNWGATLMSVVLPDSKGTVLPPLVVPILLGNVSSSRSAAMV